MHAVPQIQQARAMIMWGQSPEETKGYLMQNGLSAADADKYIASLVSERNRVIKSRARRKIIIGAAVMTITGVYLIQFSGNDTISSYRSAKGAAAIALIGLYGAWLLADGIMTLLRPKAEQRCLTEI
jgi:predicted phage tail protein